MSLSLYASLLLAIPDASGLPVTDSPTQAEGVFVAPVEREYAQVRIEERVLIRVPRRRPIRSSSMENFSARSAPVTYKEKKIGKCVPMSNILGVHRFGDRYLDLVTKNHQDIRVRFEEKCQAHNFYSGFYMEKSSDGRLCADRDVLHSRTGAKCEIDRFRRLVPE